MEEEKGVNIVKVRLNYVRAVCERLCTLGGDGRFSFATAFDENGVWNLDRFAGPCFAVSETG